MVVEVEDSALPSAPPGFKILRWMLRPMSVRELSWERLSCDIPAPHQAMRVWGWWGEMRGWLRVGVSVVWGHTERAGVVKGGHTVVLLPPGT